MKAFDTFQGLVDAYEDTIPFHTSVRDDFFRRVEEDRELIDFRVWVLSHRHGFGETQFYWMWNLITQVLPQDFKFLEIGVFRGQIPCLVTLLAHRYGLRGKIYGVTPLSTIGFTDLPDNLDFERDIIKTFTAAKQPMANFQLIVGNSTDKDVIYTTGLEGPFDLVYIDGGHEYDTVVSDVKHYAEMVKAGGLLVIDDASCHLQLPLEANERSRRFLEGNEHWSKGIIEVSEAVEATVMKDNRFAELFAVGHNRVWRRNETV
jgi:cephalosporin hydroxylase